MAFGHPVTTLILGELFGALLLLQALQKKSYWPALIGMIVVYIWDRGIFRCHARAIFSYHYKNY